MKIEYVLRQADVRALRRAVWLRNRRVHAFAGVFGVCTALAIVVQPVFGLIAVVVGAMLARSVIGLVVPWRPLSVEVPIELHVGEADIRLSHAGGRGGSPTGRTVAWPDLEAVRDLPRHVVLVSGLDGVGDIVVPRSAFAASPGVLEAIRERVAAAA